MAKRYTGKLAKSAYLMTFSVNSAKVTKINKIAIQSITFKNMFRTFVFLVSTFVFAPALFAEPLWGSKTSQLVDIPPHKLKPGQFIWKGHAVPLGPIKAEINISEQRIYVHRNGVLIGVSTISTGRGRRSTPTGVFRVQGKSRFHRSRKYNNAAMPYTQWLTSKGIAMHAGKLPGYPASHGCIRMPTKFARLLFESSFVGMPVVITRHKKTEPESQSAQPVTLLPIADKAAKLVTTAAPVPVEEFRWQPEAVKDGPISIVISKADKSILVYRNGIEIGRAKLSLVQPEKPLGTQAYIMQKGEGKGINLFLANAPPQQWLKVGLPGDSDKEGEILNSSLLDYLTIPIDFAKALNSVLMPGTTLLINDGVMPELQITNLAQNTLKNSQPAAVSQPKTVPLKPDEPASTKALVETKTLDAEIQKTQAKVESIKKELADIEQQRRK